MKLKILSVDYNFENGRINNISFEDKISFSEYNVVIIDPLKIPNIWFTNTRENDDGTHWTYSMYDKGYGKRIEEIINRRKEEIELLLSRNQGILVCFLRSVGELLYMSSYRNDNKVRYISKYSWIPTIEVGLGLDIGEYIKDRYGSKIQKYETSHSFADYFENIKEYIQYEAVLDDEIFKNYDNKELLTILKPIAFNKAKELLAFEFAFGKSKIIFIPPIPGDSEKRKAKNLVINCVRDKLNLPQLDSAPEWINKYSIKGEDELNAKLKTIENEEAELERKREKINGEIYRLNLLKGLLYESGRNLESAVREAFKIIGFNVWTEMLILKSMISLQ